MEPTGVLSISQTARTNHWEGEFSLLVKRPFILTKFALVAKHSIDFCGCLVIKCINDMLVLVTNSKGAKYPRYAAINLMTS